MSGIAAIFNRNGAPVQEEALDRIARSLSIYGPEWMATRRFGSAGLAYTHLANAPETGGLRQPLTGGGGRFALVFDGRFDNREDIAGVIGLAERDLHRTADAALALACWERWGSDAADRWVGEFALIVWDAKLGTMTALRDQFGGRPLHYHERGDRIAIASMPKGIHALGDVPRVLDERKLAHALCIFDILEDHSFFRDVAQLPPAHILIASQDRLQKTRYYDLAQSIRPVSYRREDDYVEAARELFEKSVASKLRTRGRVGAFMSGGLDSSAGAVIAAQFLGERGERLPAFTAVPEPGWDGRGRPGRIPDEGPNARAVAEMHPGIDLHLVDAAGRGPSHFEDRFLLASESPITNILNSIWHHAILERAKAQGITAMLSGDNGNMTLSYSGAGVYGHLWDRGRYAVLARELAAYGPNPLNVLRQLARHLGGRVVPVWLKRRKQSSGTSSDPAADAWQERICATGEFAAEQGVTSMAEELELDFSNRALREPRVFWAQKFMRYNNVARGPIVKAHEAMFGIEIRDPFADRRIVEWSLGVPETQFCRNGRLRWLMRRLMKGRLPDAVLHSEARGQQSADWHLRMTRDRELMQRDLANFRRDADLARMIDLDKLAATLEDWPESTVTEKSDRRGVSIPVRLPLALQVGRFVQREKGTNNAPD